MSISIRKYVGITSPGAGGAAVQIPVLANAWRFGGGSPVRRAEGGYWLRGP